MKRLNDNIRVSLNDYLDNPSPNHAIFIDGEWGCGKTTFIKSWQSEKQEEFRTSSIIWQPVYVSLFGLTKTRGIVEEINQQLYPVLTKVKKYGGILLSAVSKVTLKTDATKFLGESKDDDIQFNAELDLFRLFKDGKEDSEFGSHKLLILDDLERCRIPIKELFGFINTFIEHSDCRVILIGDKTKLVGENEQDFNDFNEKLIGKTLKVTPNTESVLQSLYTDLVVRFPRSVKFLKQNEQLILDTFEATTYNNLRVLKQSIYDFCLCYEELKFKRDKDVKVLSRTLLANYIALYCEYKSKSIDILNDWNAIQVSLTTRHLLNKKEEKETEQQKRFAEIGNRYRNLAQRYNINLFGAPVLERILGYLKTGESISSTYNTDIILTKRRNKLNDWEIVLSYWQHSNDVFENAAASTIEKIKKLELDHQVMFNAINIFYYLESKKIYDFPAKDEEDIVKALEEHIVAIPDRTTLEEFYRKYYQGFSTIEKILSERRTSFQERISTAIRNRSEEIGSRGNNLAKNLSDENIDDLYSVDDESDYFYRNSQYRNSLFHGINPEDLAERISALSNASKQKFNSLILSKYWLESAPSPLESGELIDEGILTQVKNILRQKEFTSIDKYWINSICQTLDKLTKRGDMNRKQKIK